jgi:toxin YoeB
MRPVWDSNAWEDYLWWQAQDRKVLRWINLLIQDAMRNGNDGIGKPEPLEHDFAGYWSTRSLTTRYGSRPVATTTAADPAARFD